MENVQPNGENRLATVLKDMVVRGDVNSQGGVRLFGRVTGNVKCGGRVEVMSEAMVEGCVESAELYVEGTVGGNVRTHVLEVGEGAVLEGNVEVALMRMRGRRYEMKRVRLTGK